MPRYWYCYFGNEACCDQICSKASDARPESGSEDHGYEFAFVGRNQCHHNGWKIEKIELRTRNYESSVHHEQANTDETYTKQYYLKIWHRLLNAVHRKRTNTWSKANLSKRCICKLIATFSAFFAKHDTSTAFRTLIKPMSIRIITSARTLRNFC